MKSDLTRLPSGWCLAKRIPNFRIILEAPRSPQLRGKIEGAPAKHRSAGQGGFISAVPCHHLPTLTEDPRVATQPRATETPVTP